MRAGAGGAGQAGRLLEDGAWRTGVCASKVSVEGTDGTSTASKMDVATRTGTGERRIRSSYSETELPDDAEAELASAETVGVERLSVLQNAEVAAVLSRDVEGSQAILQSGEAAQPLLVVTRPGRPDLFAANPRRGAQQPKTRLTTYAPEQRLVAADPECVRVIVDEAAGGGGRQTLPPQADRRRSRKGPLHVVGQRELLTPLDAQLLGRGGKRRASGLCLRRGSQAFTVVVSVVENPVAVPDAFVAGSKAEPSKRRREAQLSGPGLAGAFPPFRSDVRPHAMRGAHISVQPARAGLVGDTRDAASGRHGDGNVPQHLSANAGGSAPGDGQATNHFHMTGHRREPGARRSVLRNLPIESPVEPE